MVPDASKPEVDTDTSGLQHSLSRCAATLIAPFRDTDITVLLLNKGDADSRATLRACLPHAHIIAVLSEGAAAVPRPVGEEIEIGDEDDPDFLTCLARKHRPKIVFDCGSAIGTGQQLRLQLLYELIPPDGLYFIKIPVAGDPPDGILDNHAGDGMLPYLLSLARACTQPTSETAAQKDDFTSEFARQTASICFRTGSCLIQKASGWHALISTEPARQASPTVTDLDNGGCYNRVSAQIVDAPQWLFDLWQVEWNTPAVHPPGAAVVELADVTVHCEGVIVTATGTVVEESLINTDSLAEFGPFVRDPRLRLWLNAPVHQRLTGENFVLLKQTWDTNYGHWLVESLPRVDLIAECYDVGSCRFIVSAAGTMRCLYLDTLAHFGIKETQIIWTDNRSFTVDRLIYPLPMTLHPWVKAPRVLRVLERLAARISSAHFPSLRLYVSRNSAGRRRLLNEPEIVHVLAQRGYSIVNPERLAFDEQIRLFKDAQTIIGNLGAALTNSVFSGHGVTLFALTSEFMKDDFYWDIMCHKRGRYVSLHGRAVDPDLGMQSDFTIDVAKFVDILDQLAPMA